MDQRVTVRVFNYLSRAAREVMILLKIAATSNTGPVSYGA